MRTALLQVKEELGAEAVIMSNKKVAGGVAIVAAKPDNPKRGRQLTGVVASGVLIVILSAVLRWILNGVFGTNYTEGPLNIYSWATVTATTPQVSATNSVFGDTMFL